MGQGQQGKVKGMPKDPKMIRVMLQTRTPVHFNVSDVKVVATCLGSVLPQPNHLTRLGGTKGMWPNPSKQQPTVDLQHSLPDPKPKLTLLQAVQKRGWPEVTAVPFLNPDPIACLVGCSNEAPVVIDGQIQWHYLTQVHKSPVWVPSSVKSWHWWSNPWVSYWN